MVKSMAPGPEDTAAEIDLRGLRCPMPALRTKKRLNSLESGDRLRVLADDPLAAIDIAHLCREEGHRLVASHRSGEAICFEIVVGGSSG